MSLNSPSQQRTPLIRTEVFGGSGIPIRGARTTVILPLTKEHLSSKDRIVWQKGCPY